MQNRPKNQGVELGQHLRNDRSLIGYNGPVELATFLKHKIDS